MQEILITLCARGGSKGIPRKNIRLIGNTHMIGFSIRHAQLFKKRIESEFNSRVKIELSTDDQEIKEVAESYGLSTNYLRSDVLANDVAGKQDVIKDVLLFSEKQEHRKYDYIVDLDVSAPMRTISDLMNAYRLFNENTKFENLFSVSLAKKNPYFNMVEQNQNGNYILSKKPIEVILSRQKAPKVYEMNASFYFYNRTFFEKEKMYLFENATIYEIKHDSFDMDHQLDIDFFEYLVVNNKLSFEI